MYIYIYISHDNNSSDNNNHSNINNSNNQRICRIAHVVKYCPGQSLHFLVPKYITDISCARREGNHCIIPGYYCTIPGNHCIIPVPTYITEISCARRDK